MKSSSTSSVRIVEDWRSKKMRCLSILLSVQILALPVPYAQDVNEDPWEINIDGVPVDYKLVEGGTRLRMDYTSVCLGEYDYFRVARFVRSSDTEFEERLSSSLKERDALCDESKKRIRASLKLEISGLETNLAGVRDDLSDRIKELAEQKKAHDDTVFSYQLVIGGLSLLSATLLAVILKS